MRAGTVVAKNDGRGGDGSRRLENIAAPKVKDFARVWQSTPAIASSTDGHLALTDQRIREGFVVTGAISLKTNAARMRSTIPFGAWNLRHLEPFALDDGHLTPVAIEPNIPGNVARSGAKRAAAFEGVKPVVKWIVNLSLDQAAADPESASPFANRFGIDAAGDLLGFKALLPGFAGVGDNQFFADDQPVHGEFFRLVADLENTDGGGRGQYDGNDAIFHALISWFCCSDIFMRREKCKV